MPSHANRAEGWFNDVYFIVLSFPCVYAFSGCCVCFFLTSLYMALASIYSNELNKVHCYKCRFNKVKVF